jgi:hypothetical protein
MADMMTVMLENRPAQPVRFMAEYFDNVVNPGTPLEKAYRYLRLTRRASDTFLDNLARAFSELEAASNIGVRGRAVNELLGLMARDLPFGTGPRVLAAVRVPGQAFVVYEDFAQSIDGFLLREELLAHALALFRLAAEAGGVKDALSEQHRVSASVLAPLLQRALPGFDAKAALEAAAALPPSALLAATSSKYAPSEPPKPAAAWPELKVSAQIVLACCLQCIDGGPKRAG